MTAFQVQLTGTVPAIDGEVIVNAGTMPSPLIDHASLLLDIDLFKAKDLPRRDDEIWALLAVLRLQKNDLVEAFITSRARELFDRA